MSLARIADLERAVAALSLKSSAHDQRLEEHAQRLDGFDLAPHVHLLEDDGADDTQPVPLIPRWLIVARGELGVAEIVGSRHNPRVTEYLATVGLSAYGDETPWCSAFVCWAMRQSDVDTKGVTGMARSWTKWGVPLDAPRVGCVVVLTRGLPDSKTGHVGLFVGQDEGRVVLLGGNQAGAPGGCVSERPYPKARVLGYRWPK